MKRPAAYYSQGEQKCTAKKMAVSVDRMAQQSIGGIILLFWQNKEERVDELFLTRNNRNLLTYKNRMAQQSIGGMILLYWQNKETQGKQSCFNREGRYCRNGR